MVDDVKTNEEVLGPVRPSRPPEWLRDLELKGWASDVAGPRSRRGLLPELIGLIQKMAGALDTLGSLVKADMGGGKWADPVKLGKDVLVIVERAQAAYNRGPDLLPAQPRRAPNQEEY